VTALDFHSAAVGLFGRTIGRTLIYIIIGVLPDSYFTRALIGLVPIQVYIEPIVWPSSVREAFEQCEIVAHAFNYDMDLAFDTFHVLGSLRQGFC
jgi:hypothetical protein